MGLNEIPDGRYTITFDVKEGRVVRVRTADECNHLIHQLMILLALVMKDLVALCFKLPEEKMFGRTTIISSDNKQWRMEDLAHELIIPSRYLYEGSEEYYPSVYILQSDDNPGWTKIGQSKYPGRRAKQLQGELIHLIPCLTCDPEAYEVVLHNLFIALKREKSGEWFRLTERDLDYLCTLNKPMDIDRQLEAFRPSLWIGMYKKGIYGINHLLPKMLRD